MTLKCIRSHLLNPRRKSPLVHVAILVQETSDETDLLSYIQYVVLGVRHTPYIICQWFFLNCWVVVVAVIMLHQEVW